MKTIELVVPCYNEEQCIEIFYKRVCEVFQNLKDYHVIITYVDDGSKDETLKRIKELCGHADAATIQYISLSRNFGKEAAIFAGLSKSIGDFVAVMDADLQHPPELLLDMLHAIEEEGYDCASARRKTRDGEPIIRSLFSRAFYHVINHVASINMVSGSTDYRLMKRKVVDAILQMPERERFTKGIYSWIGYNNKWIEYENVERVAGKTKWNILGLFKYAYSGFIAFATAPLRGVVYLGMFIVVISVIYSIAIFVGALNSTAARNGYASIMIVMLLLGGVIITILGMIGEYLARIYMEVKNRPIFVEKDTNISQNKQFVYRRDSEESSGNNES